MVSPGAWIFHKGLTFPKRKSKSKIYKDLYGIWYVSTQLGGLSDAVVNEVANLAQQKRNWFRIFHNNIIDWVDNAAPIDWQRLEEQDPFGQLKKIGFERALKNLISKKQAR